MITLLKTTKFRTFFPAAVQTKRTTQTQWRTVCLFQFTHKADVSHGALLPSFSTLNVTVHYNKYSVSIFSCKTTGSDILNFSPSYLIKYLSHYTENTFPFWYPSKGYKHCHNAMLAVHVDMRAVFIFATWGVSADVFFTMCLSTGQKK